MRQLEEDTNEKTYVSVNDKLREIYLFGTVTEETAATIIPILRALDAEGRKDIKLVISSAGGSVSAGWAIFDALSNCKNVIVAECYGECMSIAALILQACDNRLLSMNCRFMIHNMSFGVNAEINKIRLAVKEDGFINKRYHEELAIRSGITVAQITKWCNQETFMSAEEAVKNGFADGVI